MLLCIRARHSTSYKTTLRHLPRYISKVKIQIDSYVKGRVTFETRKYWCESHGFIPRSYLVWSIIRYHGVWQFISASRFLKLSTGFVNRHLGYLLIEYIMAILRLWLDDKKTINTYYRICTVAWKNGYMASILLQEICNGRWCRVMCLSIRSATSMVLKE